MRYVLTTDLHGNTRAAEKLGEILFDRGWRNLYHPEETLIVMGDSSDRGPLSLYLHWVFSRSDSVVHLMGNHDYKIVRWSEGYKKDFYPTKELLEGDAELAAKIVEAVREYPYTFVGKGFVAAHAYPFGSREEAMYGPTKNQERIPWWEEYTLRDYAVFFGHYHKLMLFPEKRLYCLDSLDEGVLTYAVVEDEKERIYHESI